MTPAAFRLVGDAVVAVDTARSVHQPGVVDVVGDRISWVGPPSGAPAPPGPVLPVGGVLMPGLVNTHGHTPMTLLRSAGDGLPLDRWLHEVVFPREARLSGEDVHWGMLLGAGELLRCGVTTTAEMYYWCADVATAALTAGIRCELGPAIVDPGGDGPPQWPSMLEAAAHLHAEYDGRDGLIRVGLAPHSAYLLPPEALSATAALADDLGALVQIHVAETRGEVDRMAAARGCSVAELLARQGLLDGPVVAAHGVWLSDPDIALFAERSVAVAHCPQSNGKLGSGVAPLAAMLERGLVVGLGTDGPASNDNLNLWEELRLAPVLARAVACDPGVVRTEQALHMATAGGAEALRLPTGVLEAGRLADVIRLELADSRLLPAGDPDELVAHLVWSAGSDQVTDVWVAGRQVVAQGRCTRFDEAEAQAEVARRARRLRAPVGAGKAAGAGAAAGPGDG